MLKLLLSAALVAPCFIIPLTSSSAEPESVVYNTPSFETTYIEPELERLEKCKSAELDVFFHENYITTHSAEYIAEGIKLSDACTKASYVITPIIPASSHIDEKDVLNVHTEELSLILEAYGIYPVIAGADVQTEFNSLSANGRTVTLKIVIKESDSA